MACLAAARRRRQPLAPVLLLASVASICVLLKNNQGPGGLRAPIQRLNGPITRGGRCGDHFVGAGENSRQRSSVVKTQSFFKAFDDTMNDFMTGWKDDKWNPDRRTEQDRGQRYRKSASTLSWGMRDWAEEAEENLKDFIKGRKYPIRIATDALDEGFDSSTDLEINESLLNRMKTAGENRYISGRKLAELVFAKYGKYHDITLFQAKPFGAADRQVAVNIYGPHLGNPSFPYSEQQYLDKLDDIAHRLNTWDQAWYVQQFLESELKPRRGLPSRPRSDTAVTLRLNQSPTWPLVPEDVVSEVFSW